MNALKFFDENRENSFRFAKEEIRFEPALFRYIELESRFEPEFKKTAGIIDAAFKKELEDIIDYTENIEAFLEKTFVPLSEFAVKQLSLEGYYDCDAQSFYTNWIEPQFERLLLIKDQLQGELDRMDMEQTQRNAIRVERRKQATREASRQFWIDRQGNIRNHADSEANYQYVKNFFGRTMDAISNSMEREKLYDASKGEIKKELMLIGSNTVEAVAYILKKNAHIDIRDTRTQEDLTKAKAIFNNLKSGVVQAEQINEAVVQVFRLNPQENGFLEWCMERYGDPDGELGRVAKLFHVDIESVKRKKLEAVVNLKTEADALASKKALENLESQLSCPAPDLENKIDNALIDFDREFRTVDGEEYKTREEAGLARQELEEVKKVLERYPMDNPEKCQAFIDAIAALTLKTSVADKYVRTARDRSSQQEDKLNEIVGKYNLSQENATILLTRHSALARSGLEGLEMFELGAAVSAGVTDMFHVSTDDIVLAYVDLYHNKKRGGLLFSQKGIYSCFIPFCKTKAGFIVMIIVIVYIVMGLFSAVGQILNEGINGGFIFLVLVSLVVLLNVLPIKKIHRSFTQLNDVSLSIPNKKKKLMINEGTTVPKFKKTKAFFDKLDEVVKEQQALQIRASLKDGEHKTI